MEEFAISGIVLAVVVVVGILYLVFIGYTIYHAIAKNRTESSFLWVLLILFFPLIGSIIYWISASRNNQTSTKSYRR